MVKKRIGRPVVEAPPGERAGLSLRVTPEIKKKLEEAAEANGRSLSQECELRLELTFARDAMAAASAEKVESAAALLDKAIVSFAKAEAERRDYLDRREAELDRRVAELKK